MAVSSKLLEAREEVKRIDEIIRALEPRVLAGDARARAKLNEALRQRDAAAPNLAALEEEDRIARGLPPPVREAEPMYGPPPVRFKPPAPPTVTNGPPPTGGSRRGWLDRLLGRK
jgi:hypothetical protein